MALVRATGGFDFNAVAAATDEVTIGAQTYKFVASPAAANDIDVGSDLDESIGNLVAAINGAAGSGTKYDADTVVSPYVTAVADLAADEIDLTCKVPGTIGNGIFLGTSETDIIVTGAGVALAGGLGDLGSELDAAVSSMQINSQVYALLSQLSPAAD